MKNTPVVGLTYNLASDYLLEDNAPEDFYGEFDSEETIDRLEAAILSLGYSVYRIGNIEKLVAFLAQNQRVDVVFNIAEGRWGRNRESQIPALLEAYSIPYTFSDPLTLGMSLDKAFTKQLWQQAGLPVAPFHRVETVADFKKPLEAELKFPLFVKPLLEGSSKGVSQESLVETEDQLEVQVERVIKRYHQPALVEEFLPGREFTVGILGTGQNARVLGVLEVPYVAVVKVNGFTQKRDHVWKTYTPVVDASLRKNLAEISVRAYQVLGCRDAGRLDIRMDKHGKAQLMEINTLSGLSGHSALPLMATQAGLTFEMLIGGILEDAMARGSTAFGFTP